MRRFAFRADADRSIGAGHVLRCRALADEIRTKGGRCSFFCKSCPAHLQLALQRAGHEVLAIGQTRPGSSPEIEDADLLLERSREYEAVVVDHYALSATWESRIRSTGIRVLAIDDLMSRTHYCDWFLDQNLRSHDGYQCAVRAGPSPTMMLGPQFALLRSEFRAMRSAAQVRPINSRVVVCLGGFDYLGLTIPIATAIKTELGEAVSVCAISGDKFQAAPSELERCRQLGIDLAERSTDIATALLHADVAIGASGSMNWERCCLGVPSLVFPIAENQLEGIEELAATRAIHRGCLETATESAVRFASMLIDNRSELTRMSVSAFCVCDGRGATRVADTLLGL
jgi:UDP-2,4-diacetamido-2,4,6-trideoxy-beta-L-altropyranose hydrolase